MAKKGSGLILADMQWTVPKSYSDLTSGACVTGVNQLQSTPVIHLIRTNGSHHQKVWAVGTHKRDAPSGIGQDNVIVKTPSGTQKWTLSIVLTTSKNVKDGQYHFTPGDYMFNADQSCGFEFNIHRT